MANTRRLRVAQMILVTAPCACRRCRAEFSCGSHGYWVKWVGLLCAKCWKKLRGEGEEAKT